ncbi:MAG TPA: FeoA family protein [Terriglobia bacterium]|nr:FeoA family protein [Terriglobia bacterium]
MTLHRIPEGTLIRILEVSVGHHLRRSLSQLGIQIGDVVHVQRHVPYGGPVLIEHRGTQVALGRSLAKRIRVELVD